MFYDIAERMTCSEEDRRGLFDLIFFIVELSNQARREGLLSLENDLADMEEFLLKVGLQLVVDGTDPETVEKLLEIHMLAANDRGITFLRKWIIKEGVLSIQEGDNPRIILDKLGACLGEKLYMELWDQSDLRESFRFSSDESFETIRHTLETLQDRYAPVSNTEDLKLKYSPAKIDDRAIQRLLREFSKSDLYRILRDVSVLSRKALLRNLSKFKIRNMIVDLEQNPGYISPVKEKPGVKIWDEAVQLLMDHGEIVSLTDIRD